MTRFLAIAGWLASAPAAAAELAISAQVDKTVVALNDQVQLDVEVRGGSLGLPDPQLPSLPNFSLFSSGRSQNISMLGGQVHTSLLFTYVLVPRFVGKAVIGPISVAEGGRSAQTQPIEISVVRPSGAGSSPAPGGRPGARPGAAPAAARAPDVFVEASVDQPRPFVNEQVTLSVRFHTAVSLLGNPDYAPPDATGFLKEDLPPLPYYQKALHGRVYYVTEVRMALFAVAPGRHTLGPAIIKAQVQQDVRLDPYAADFFQRFFQFGAAGSRTIEVRSDPLPIDVQPLPEAGRPRDFTGAVGSYQLSAVLSRSEVKVGDAVDLALIVSGKGNLKTVLPPRLPELPAFRVYDTLSSLSLKKEADSLQGSRTFKTVLVPRASGRLSIPPVAFSFFDPKTRSYATRAVGPLELKVAPGDGAAAPAEPGGPSRPAGAVAVESDIQHIVTGTLRRDWTAAAGSFARLGPGHAAPVLAWLGCLAVFGARSRRLRRHPLEARFLDAWPAALRRLKAARGEADAARSVARLAEVLVGYLADKLGLAAQGLTLRLALAALKDRAPDLPEARRREIQALWQELDVLRYAPGAPASALPSSWDLAGDPPAGTPPAVAGSGAGAHAELAHRLEALIQMLEREIGR